MIFVLAYFRALKKEASYICKSADAFRFSHFLVPSRQRNHRKSFYCNGKHFAKENFRAPVWSLAECYYGNKTGNPEVAVSLHLARSGSQSQRGIWFSLPGHVTGHMIKYETFHISLHMIKNVSNQCYSSIVLLTQLLPELYSTQSCYHYSSFHIQRALV